MFGADALPKVNSFLSAPAAPLIEKFAEILVTAVSPLLMFSTSCLLFTPYLMAAPFLVTVSP